MKERTGKQNRETAQLIYQNISPIKFEDYTEIDWRSVSDRYVTIIGQWSNINHKLRAISTYF